MSSTTTTHDDDTATTGSMGTPSTMRAFVQDRYGGPEVLRLTTIDVPAPRPDEVLLEVAAAGVDRGVWHLMTGLPRLQRILGFGLRAPATPTPGLDVTGRVVAVGADVTRFVVGDEVLGIARGAFAEYAVARESKLVRRPAGLTDAQAAVLAISGGTALQALTDVGRLERGQRVLVVGASGGVGSYAVQLAVALGGRVTGVASGGKLDLVRSLGAEAVIDYTRQSLDAEGGDYDLVVDIGGRTPVRHLRDLLTDRGTLVIVGGEDGGEITGGVGRQVRAALLSPFVRQRLRMFVASEHHGVLQRVVEHVATGAVVPAVDRTVRLEQVPDAIRALEAGEVRGKVAVLVGGAR